MALPRFDIPFVCENTPICPAEEFYDWPQTRGWTWDLDLPMHIFASRMQSWMFFGLISSYLDKNDMFTFVEDNENGRTALDIVVIKDAIKEWQHMKLQEFSDSNADDPEIRPSLRPSHSKEGFSSGLLPSLAQSWRRKHEVLRFATEVMNNDIVPYLRGQDDDPIGDLWNLETYQVIFGIDLLLDILYESLPLGPTTHSRRSLAADVKPIRNSIVRTGRCPSLGKRLRPSSTDWLRLLFLPPVGQAQDHSACLAHRCLRHNIDVATYVTQHTEECPGCSFIDADQDLMKECIAAGKIPLVCLSRNSKGTIQMKSVKGTLKSDYVAISHVWSGGLGNFTRNALPVCQLQRLLDIVEAMPKTANRGFSGTSIVDIFDWPIDEAFLPLLPRKRGALLWLDTLCIPVAVELASYRKTAIDTMAQLYAGAAGVLVLDPDLQQLPYEILTRDAETMAMFIRVSPWMSRSWPLQEGAVASKLFFQLKDRSVLLGANFPHDDGVIANQDIGLPRSHFLGEIFKPSLEVNMPDHSPLFCEVWNSLLARSTTEPSDVHGIFAALVNLSAGEILSLPPTQRLQAIIKAQKTIPLSIMFQPRAQNDLLDHDGTWVPQFPGADSATSRISSSYGVLAVTTDGLALADTAATFALVARIDIVSEHTFVLLDRNRRYHVRLGTRGPERLFEPVSYMFVLSEACSEAGSGYQGACFSIQDLSDSTARLRLKTDLVWSYADHNDNEKLDYTCEYMEKFVDPKFKVLIDVGMLSDIAIEYFTVCQ